MNINRIIFCDSENIQKDTLKVLEVAREDDLIVVMCSPNTFKIEVYELNYFSECKGGIELFNCSAGTQNAMDFYIVSEVVASMARGEANEYFIISNDKGYSPLIKLWNTRGYKLHLISDPDLLRYDLDNRRILQGTDVVNDFKQKNKVLYQVDGIKNLKFDNRTIVLKRMIDTNETEEETEEVSEAEVVSTDTIVNDESKVIESIEEPKEKSEIAIKIEEASKEIEEKHLEVGVKEAVDTENNLEKEKVQQLNDSIKEFKEKVKKKETEELKDMSLEDLQDATLPTRDFNIKKIKENVGQLSASKEKDLLTVISDYTEYTEEVEDLLKGIFRRNQNTYLEKIKNSWNVYRHE